MTNFWLSELARTAVLLLTAYALGVWVQRTGVRVNYTRKIQHFVILFFPLALYSYLPYEGSAFTVAASGAVFVATLTLFARPLRTRVRFLATAFASFDRPEDRPYTLLWLSTQLLATYAVLLLMLARFFTDRLYTRSLEGSACVLASGFLAVFLLRGELDATELALAAAIIPLAMTLAEAWSPHTWDGPFLYLAGGASTVATLELSRLLG